MLGIQTIFPLRRGFNGVAKTKWPLFDNEEAVIQNTDALVDDVREFFRENNYQIAQICLDILLEEKGDSKRLDDRTMNFVHELRPIQYARAFIKLKLIPFKDPNVGDAEKLFCAQLIHDLGEDYGLSKSELRQRIITKIAHLDNIDGAEQDRLQDIAFEVSDVMELMTFERKYKPKDAKKLFAKKFGYEETYDEEKFKNYILKELYPDAEKRKKVYVTKDSKDRIIISAYGRDWNSYITGMLANPWAMLAKFFDRCEGLATRIGVEKFTLEKNQTYCEETRICWQKRQTVHEAQERYPALHYAFESIDSMMGILHDMLDMVNVYSREHDTSERHFKIQESRPANFFRYGYALEASRETPDGFNFIKIALNRIKQIGEKESRFQHLYTAIKDGIHDLEDSSKAFSEMKYGLWRAGSLAAVEFRKRIGLSNRPNSF